VSQIKSSRAAQSGISEAMPTLVAAPYGAAEAMILYVPGGPYENLPAGLVTGATGGYLSTSPPPPLPKRGRVWWCFR